MLNIHYYNAHFKVKHDLPASNKTANITHTNLMAAMLNRTRKYLLPKNEQS